MQKPNVYRGRHLQLLNDKAEWWHPHLQRILVHSDGLHTHWNSECECVSSLLAAIPGLDHKYLFPYLSFKLLAQWPLNQMRQKKFRKEL